jgi:hypothetical protein
MNDKSIIYFLILINTCCSVDEKCSKFMLAAFSQQVGMFVLKFMAGRNVIKQTKGCWMAGNILAPTSLEEMSDRWLRTRQEVVFESQVPTDAGNVFEGGKMGRDFANCDKDRLNSDLAWLLHDTGGNPVRSSFV